MPFTVSHASAVIPIFSKHVSRSALVIGSMIPDLPLFLEAGRYDVSHSFTGILFYNLPVGFVAWLIWTHIMRAPTKALCPEPLKSLFDYSHRTSNKKTIIVSLIIGAATHVIWDGFTHLNAFGPALFPVLLARVFDMPIYKWLQITCSIFGLAYLCKWLIAQWDKKVKFTPIEALRSIGTWMCVLLTCICYAGVTERFKDGRFFLYGTIITSMQMFFSCWFLYCISSLMLDSTSVKIADSSKETG